MAKFDRLVIYGEQQASTDTNAIARVVIMLARLWLRRAAKEQAAQAPEKEAAS